MADTLQPRFQPVDRQADNSQAHPFNPSRGDGRMTLSQLFGSGIVQAVKAEGKLTFQATGDTGKNSQAQHEVAFAMGRDLDPRRREKGPLFFLNLGDVIYDPMKKEGYANRFYRPNLEYIQAPLTYDAAILAIPGNHDGEVRSPADDPSLSAFWENFCQPAGSNAPMAQSFGVTMPDQPGAYWWLDAPFLDLVGLYSNSKENAGMLGADDTEMHQRNWLRQTLTKIGARRNRASRKGSRDSGASSAVRPRTKGGRGRPSREPASSPTNGRSLPGCEGLA